MTVWNGYYNLAYNLVGLPDGADPCNESIKRSAISRAYYSAFNLAIIHLKTKGNDVNVPHGINKHKYVPEQFLSSPDSRHQEIGYQLISLRNNRNKADYGDRFPNIDAQATSAVFEASSIISSLATLV